MAIALAAILGALGSVAILAILIILVWFFLCRGEDVSITSETDSSDPFIHGETRGRVESSLGGGTRIFGMKELYVATSNFSDQNFIGEGKFGRVYRGLLRNGMLVAIKKRPGIITEDFADEACYLSYILHRNLVTLLGHCQENNLQFLVYEYVPNGSVSSHLFSNVGEVPFQMLQFKHKLSIAIGAAKGLAHLHYISPPMLHKDFKTANVLVDENFTAKVADAGTFTFLERVDLAGSSSQVTADADEIFHAPEVTQFSHFSVKSDVYSFGVFLLELVSGRQAKEPPFSDSSLNLVEWVRSSEESDEISNIIGEKMESIFTEEGMEGCVELVIRCVDPLSEKRPGMAYVVKELERILEHE